MKPAFLTLALLITSPTLAQAAVPCMPAAEMEAGLQDWYGQAPVDGAQTSATQM